MVLPVAGSFHGFVPLDSPTKLATALGACAGKSVHFRSPAEVWMMAGGNLWPARLCWRSCEPVSKPGLLAWSAPRRQGPNTVESTLHESPFVSPCMSVTG